MVKLASMMKPSLAGPHPFPANGWVKGLDETNICACMYAHVCVYHTYLDSLSSEGAKWSGHPKSSTWLLKREIS